MVKVLAIEGNRIKLSRKALIKEQKAKLAQSSPAEPQEDGTVSEPFSAPPAPPVPARPRNEFDERQPKSNQSTILIEGGDDFEEGSEELDEETEPNFNRVDGAAPVAAGQFVGAGRPAAGGGPNNNNNRRRRRRRPGGGSGGGRGPGGGQG
jgi:polyribonucleotide nucleotidyltransferase